MLQWWDSFKADTHQRRLAQKLTTAYQVTNGHVEVVVAAAPVRDLGERVDDQNLL